MGTTTVKGGRSTKHFGAGVNRSLTSLVTDMGEAAESIEGGGGKLDYGLLRIRSGRLVVVKDMDNRNFVVTVSTMGAGKHIFLTGVERLPTMIEDPRGT